jgi:RNA polymerase sigma-70 factor (ECF subfamily)
MGGADLGYPKVRLAIPGTEDTSITLLDRIQAGEKSAWHRLMTLYAPLIRYWGKRWGVIEAELDDVTQEVWLALGPTLRDYRRWHGCSFRAWLRGVTFRKVQEWNRRRSLQVAAAEGGSVALRYLGQIEAEPNDDGSTDPGEIVETNALTLRALRQVQGEFEDRTWRAFLGVAIESKSTAEVASALGLSTAAVRMAKCRVFHRLREELGDVID